MASVRQLISALEASIEAGEIKETDLVVLSGDPEGNRFGLWDATLGIGYCDNAHQEVYDHSDVDEPNTHAKPSIVLYPI